MGKIDEDIHKAIRLNDLSKVKYFLTLAFADPNGEYNGICHFNYACSCGNILIVEELWNHKIGVKFRSCLFKSPLHAALAGNKHLVVNFLIRQGHPIEDYQLEELDDPIHENIRRYVILKNIT